MTAIDTDVAAVQRMFDINVFGPMRMVRTFHPMIIAAQGTIVNIGSIGGIIPFIYGCGYSSFFRFKSDAEILTSIIQRNQSCARTLGKHFASGNGTISVRSPPR
jgi:hypothetical protein